MLVMSVMVSATSFRVRFLRRVSECLLSAIVINGGGGWR